MRTDNVDREIWRYLKMFTYQDYVANYVSDETAQKQIVSCIEQASEIYSVSKSIGLITSPILMYFGMQNMG